MCCANIVHHLRFKDPAVERAGDLVADRRVLGMQVVLRAPAVLELSVEDTLLPRVAFLRDTVGIAEENLGKVIMRLPSVLTYSEESMQQRIDFLLEAGLSPDDLAKAVTSHTQVPLALPAHAS